MKWLQVIEVCWQRRTEPKPRFLWENRSRWAKIKTVTALKKEPGRPEPEHWILTPEVAYLRYLLLKDVNPRLPERFFVTLMPKGKHPTIFGTVGIFVCGFHLNGRASKLNFDDVQLMVPARHPCRVCHPQLKISFQPNPYLSSYHKSSAGDGGPQPRW